MTITQRDDSMFVSWKRLHIERKGSPYDSIPNTTAALATSTTDEEKRIIARVEIRGEQRTGKGEFGGWESWRHGA